MRIKLAIKVLVSNPFLRIPSKYIFVLMVTISSLIKKMNDFEHLMAFI